MKPPPDTSSPTIPDAFRGLRILGGCDNYTPDSSGGAERAAHEIYRRMGAAGGDLHVLSVPHGTPYDDPGVEVVVARGVDLSRLVGGYLGVSPQVFRLATLQRRSFVPQALHANTIHYNACIALARLARKHDLPFVVTAQLGPVDEMPWATRTAAATYEKTIGRYIVRSASRVLAVSSSVRDHMISVGADPDLVTVVENGVDHERFSSPPLDETSDPLILSIGRIVENKGPQLLVDAAIELAGRGRRPRIEFLGDGPLRAPLEARIASAGLSDTVRFHGQVRGVEDWLRRADVVVRPSFTEGLPLAVLEAMSAGRLNIVSDIAPNRELIEHEVSGLCFATGDAADLATQLCVAIDQPSARRRMAEAGRAASLSRSWDRMAAETAAALMEGRRS